MLRFFKLNDPYRLLVLVFILTVFSLPTLIFQSEVTIQELKIMLIGEALVDGKMLYAELFDSTGPLSSIFFGFVNWLCGHSIFGRKLVALVLIFAQASFFAIILIRNKAYTESTYLPALIVGILCFLSFDFLSITPELLGSIFLLMAINNLFKEIEFKIQRDEIVLNLGIYIGVASLFLFSFSIFLIASIVILLIYTRIDFRKYVLLIIGFGLPHVFLICFYFYNNEFDMLLQNFYYPNLTVGGSVLVSPKTLIILLTIPFIFLVLAFLKLNTEGRFTKYQSQLSQVMFLWMAFALIHFLIAKELTPHSFIIFVPSFAYFISHYFLLVKRRKLAEYLLGFFLVGVIGIATFAMFRSIPGVSYESMFAKKSQISFQNKKIMILKDGLEDYQSNKLAGYFLDWELSKVVVDEPDYYEHVILMKEMFDSDAPEIIIDPQEKMKAFFKRIPAISDLYKQDGDVYIKINN
jgi:hypothetical protein